jgi:hypothetical protein
LKEFSSEVYSIPGIQTEIQVADAKCHPRFHRLQKGLGAKMLMPMELDQSLCWNGQSKIFHAGVLVRLEVELTDDIQALHVGNLHSLVNPIQGLSRGQTEAQRVSQ